jgi:hypothetical protein
MMGLLFNGLAAFGIWELNPMHFQRVLLLTLIAFLPQQAAAQQQDIFNLFGGLVRSGIAAATQADWERLPNPEVACIDRALRERGSSINNLVRQGIPPSDGRIAEVRGGCRDQTASSGPSFDCRRATYPDEVTICGDPELAGLDRLIAEGYRSLVERLGQGAARSMTAPQLASRHACRSDAGCIKNVQISTIGELQRQGAQISSAAAAPTAPESPFVVDGLRLGGHLALGSPSYLEYRCTPSEQYTGFTWCQRRRSENSARGQYISSNTILHSADGTALYVNRYLEPAFFAGNEAIDDIRRLAAKFGEPRYITPPSVSGAPRTLMASWGNVVLEPLDAARLADLAAGREARAGVLIDHIGNFQRSAAMGLPVYRLTGGAGYVWAASWDQGGRGTLRFLTIDASRLAPSSPNAGQDLVSNSPAMPSNPPSAGESLNVGPATTTSAPAPQPTSQPSPQPTTTASEPVFAVQPAPPESPKPESLAQAPSPAQVAPSNASPASSTKPVVAQTDPKPASQGAVPNPQPSNRPSADQPVQPRVVGPPIAIQPTAKIPETNYVQWALLAVVLILVGAVGFLLFDRRKRTDSAPNLVIAPVPTLTGDKAAESLAMVSSDEALHPRKPDRAALAMQEPPPLPIALPEAASTGGTSSTSAPAAALQRSDLRRSSIITEHRHFGIGLIAAFVTIFALMSTSIGWGGLIPMALAIYLLPTIIAFKVRHHYAWPLAAINVFFGFTVLGWLGIFVWALIGPRKSALDGMSQHSALGLAKAPGSDPAVLMSDYDLRSGWKMPVVQAEIFSFADDEAPVESGDSIKVFFKSPVIGIWRSGASSSEVNSVRYNATTQIRCVAKIAAETKLRVGRTLGRTALTGIGAAILTGREAALGAAFLDYRFGGDEADEVVAALIVLSDYSSLVVQSESQEFEKFCALLPSHLLSEELAIRTAEEIDRIKRMAADGPRVLEEMRAQIAETEKSIANFAEQAQTGQTFAERDEGRIGQSEAEGQLINERAVLNAVDRLIKLASSRNLGRRIA